MNSIPSHSDRVLPRIDTVVWDYDGTLVNTRYADEAAVAELVHHYPAARSGAQVFWASEGLPLVERVYTAWPGASDDILQLFRRAAPPHAVDGIQETLNVLYQHGYRMGVVSSRLGAPLREGLDQMGLTAYFSVVVALDDVSHPKPHPEGLQLALHSLGASPIQAAFVGDSEVDVIAGAAAGMTTWHAVWTAQQPYRAHQRNIVRHPDDVLQRLHIRHAAAS